MIDTHMHLDSIFYYRDRNKIIEKCKNEGVTKMINIGTNYNSSIESIKLAQMYDYIYASVGIHPAMVNEINSHEVNKLSDIAQENKKVVAIGEIGLDYAIPEYNCDLQKEVFIKQINIAKKLELPVIIHCRNAHTDVLKILKSVPLPIKRGTIHSFIGDITLAREYIDLGFYISLSGNVTYEGEKTLEEIKKIDIEKLLIESDSPYIAPMPFKNKRNYPGNIKTTIDYISNAFEKSAEEISKITSENAEKLFNI